jgi:hypothetical protein
MGPKSRCGLKNLIKNSIIQLVPSSFLPVNYLVFLADLLLDELKRVCRHLNKQKAGIKLQRSLQSLHRNANHKRNPSALAPRFSVAVNFLPWRKKPFDKRPLLVVYSSPSLMNRQLVVAPRLVVVGIYCT